MEATTKDLVKRAVSAVESADTSKDALKKASLCFFALSAVVVAVAAEVMARIETDDRVDRVMRSK